MESRNVLLVIIVIVSGFFFWFFKDVQDRQGRGKHPICLYYSCESFDFAQDIRYCACRTVCGCF